MRLSSAAQMKGTSKCPCLDVPREGTRDRTLMDLFLINRGKPIHVAPPDMVSVHRLRDFWGLDIRKRTPGQFVCIGEWFGRKYISYLD